MSLSIIPDIDGKRQVCTKCGGELSEEWAFCPLCGRPADWTPPSKKRGNGQGCILRTYNGKYKAIVTLGYYLDENGKRHRKTRSQIYDKKRDAAAAIPHLLETGAAGMSALTLQELYDKWLPTHRAGDSTIGNYTAAFKYFEDIAWMRMQDITVDDLQECLDDCPRGRATRRNMKTVAGLIYKYGIPRKAVPDKLNLADYLVVEGDGAVHRESFTDIQIAKIKKIIGKVPNADAVYCMIYTGFRPSEFLALTAADYDRAAQTLTGGAKTEAGRGRVVTISPRIKPLVEARAASGGLLCANERGERWELKDFTERAFYPVLIAAGIENPLVTVGGGVKRHKYTPHTCRHTFATLMKRVAGADKDKLELIGHASAEMLRYYQDVSLDDLRKITDAL